MDGQWKRPGSPDLEHFVMWLLRVAFVVVLLILAVRYAVTADVDQLSVPSLPTGIP